MESHLIIGGLLTIGGCDWHLSQLPCHLAIFHDYSLTPLENNLGRARKKRTVDKVAFLKESARARTFYHILESRCKIRVRVRSLGLAGN